MGLVGCPVTGFFPLAFALAPALSAKRSFFVKILEGPFCTGGTAGFVASFSFAFCNRARYPFFGPAGVADEAMVGGGVGLGDGAVALGAVDDALAWRFGLLTIGLATLAPAGAAVPRYGMVEIGAGGFGRPAPGVAVGRAPPFVCAGWPMLLVRGNLTWLLSTGPEALRLS